MGKGGKSYGICMLCLEEAELEVCGLCRDCLKSIEENEPPRFVDVEDVDEGILNFDGERLHINE